MLIFLEPDRMKVAVVSTVAIASLIAGLVGSFGLQAQPGDRSWTLEPYDFPEGVPPSAVGSHGGKLYAFVRSNGDVRELIVHRSSDDSESRIASADEIGGDLSWSSDDRSLAYGSDDGVWVVSADGREPARRITPREFQASAPTWSRDGRWIAYLNRQGDGQDLWAVDVHEGTRKQLTDHSGSVWRPRWSPTSELVAFHATWDDEMTDIYYVSANSLQLTRVTAAPGEDFFPSWSSDGQTIYFVSRRGSSESAMWAYDLDSGTETRLTVGYDLLPLNGSPNGPFLVRRYAGESGLFRVAPSGERRVQVISGDAMLRAPDASPAADLVAVITDELGPEESLMTTDIDGEPIHAFGDGTVLQRNPRFSPDGKWIAFLVSLGGWRDSNDIWLARSDGSGAHPLTNQGYMVNALWCGEDGDLVLSGRDGDGFGKVQLWRGRVDRPGVESLLASESDLLACDCTPDGKLIYVEAGSNGALTQTLDLRSGAVGTLENLPAGAEGVRFSPDGKSFAYLLNTDGKSDLYMYDAKTGGHVQLTDSAPRKSWPAWNYSGQWIWYVERRVESQLMQLIPPD